MEIHEAEAKEQEAEVAFLSGPNVYIQPMPLMTSLIRSQRALL